MKNRIFAAIFTAFFGVALLATDYPIRTVNGEQFYEYTVQKSEGLFAVARKFEVSQADLIEANPILETQSGLRLGQTLLIPIKKEAKKELENYKLHLVQPKQTLYSLARNNNVTINELINLNPELKDGLKAGQTIKIPTSKPQIPAKIVVVDETEEEIKLVEEEPILFENEELEDAKKTDSVLSLLPDSLVEKSEESTVETVAEKGDTNAMKIALMLPLMSQTADLDNISDKFLEYYKGVLIALAKAKERGISAEMQVFDTEKSTVLLDSFLQAPFFDDVDLIVGPAYADQAEKVLNFAQEKGIKTVIPFTSQLDKSAQNQFLYQFNPTFGEIFGKITTDLAENIGERSAIIVRFQNNNDQKISTFVKNLKKSLADNQKSYHEIFITAANVDTLTTLADNEGSLLVLASRNVNDVAQFLPKIAQLHLPNLTVWGFEEWGDEWLSFLDKTYFYSLFYRNKNLNNYEKRYSEWFGKRDANSVPAYDLLGHDIVTYFINVWNGKQADNLQEMLQSDIVFERNEGEQKWTNLNYYIFVFDGKQIKLRNE